MGRTTTIAGRDVPFQGVETAIVEFSGGRRGETEAGPWEFWTVFNHEGRECTARCRAGEDPGERFNKTEKRKGEEGCWQAASSAIGIRPATMGEIIRWLKSHPDDWPFAERCQIGSTSWNIVKTDRDFSFEPV